MSFNLIVRNLRYFRNVPIFNGIIRNVNVSLLNNCKYLSNFTLFDVKWQISGYPTSQVRYKSRKKTQKASGDVSSDETESDKDFLDSIHDKHTQTVKLRVNSLRLDGIIKSALGIARNKIEQLFYENKIRINGNKVLKKGVSVKENDEIDVIKGVSTANSEFLVVARIEILSCAATDDGEAIEIKIRRCKSLTIENYNDRFVLKE